MSQNVPKLVSASCGDIAVGLHVQAATIEGLLDKLLGPVVDRRLLEVPEPRGQVEELEQSLRSLEIRLDAVRKSLVILTNRI